MPPTVVHRSEFIYRIILLASLLGMVFVSIRSLQPPAEESDRFSTEAAMNHLDFIASEVHSVGLPHHKAVHDYLMNEFARLGYAVHSQDAVSVIPLRNVVARRAGLVPGNKAVMLAAHYDSVRMGPGAGDDGAAVAALLEVARDVSTGFYRNDIIFLITDGEEMGLWGAKLFVEKHPWANDVGVVLNFDARGTSGPSIMYETSENNSWLIDQFAQVDPHPVCGSMTQEVYHQMPNKTDFTIFRQTMPGLNFAFIGSYANYHTANDDLNHLDVASMRHHGTQALALVEQFAQKDLSNIPRDGNDVYFDVLSKFVVRYPMAWAPAIACAAALISLIAIWMALRMKLISLAGIAGSLGLFFVNLLVVWGFCWSILWITRGVNLDQRANWAITAFALLTCAITLAIFLSAMKLSSLELAAAGLLIWGTLALLSVIVSLNESYLGSARLIGPALMTLRGASYLIAWSLLFSSIGFACTLFLTGSIGAVRTLILILAALPAGLLTPRMVYLAALGLKLGKAPLLMMLVVLLVWLLPLQVRPRPLVLPQPADTE